MRNGRPTFDDSLRFPDAADEALLASVTLTELGKRTKLKADIWLAKGRLFSLVFNKPPKQFFTGANLKSVEPNISSVKIWFEPMQPYPIDVNVTMPESELTGWLRELSDKCQWPTELSHFWPLILSHFSREKSLIQFRFQSIAFPS
jgi:hypothetical protein